jgi:folate-dependent phosphoribosylglycinamide formyltransferase PurN
MKKIVIISGNKTNLSELLAVLQAVAEDFEVEVVIQNG